MERESVSDGGDNANANAAVGDESAFHAEADRTLAALMEAIDESLGDALDVELQSGVLTIELEAGGQYVINKHAPNRQIWMSSPASGASHFSHEQGRGWIATRSGQNLLEMLAGELSAATGKPIALA